ncbi:zinc ABC transporter substrate-binding protein [Cohaesibacter celericrescens]|uniref:zinc ABC transporter substrate-binding protein n=1 Tax=Cohaesibacter celericrescens TaxID=2067669 RepID=UPI003566F398
MVRNSRKPTLLVSLIALAALGSTSIAGAAPKVVTSIAPIHSIASAIMLNVGTPDLLIEQSASPHASTLRPSNAKTLQAADLVIWVGPDIEPMLVKPIQTLASDAHSLELIQTKGLTLLPLREGKNWEKHSHGDEEHDHHEGHETHEDHDDHESHEAHEDHDHDAGHDDEAHIDNHIWLDPQNGILLASAIKNALIAQDPDNTELYTKNEKTFIDSVQQVMAQAKTQLEGKSDKPFIVFHDAYHYFENRFGVEAIGSIMLQPGTTPGAARVKEIRTKLKALDAACLLSEPQFSAAILPALTEGTNTKLGELDPIGKSLTLGPSLYPDLIADNARHLSDCLSDD